MGYRFAGLAAAAIITGVATGALAEEAAGKVALMLPDAKTSRYDTKDRPYFEAKMKELCPKCEVMYNNANADAGLQLNAAQAALTAGAKVLVIMAVDTTAAAAIADLAKAQGVPVIAYSRLIANSDGVTYAVLFDNRGIGEIQARGLVKGLEERGKANPKIVMINGSPTDSNATLFKEAAHEVFDPLVKAGKLTIAKEYDTPDWSPDRAQEEMQQALTAMGNAVDGVYAANDGTASGAVAAMRAAGVDPFPPVTGLDADLAATQRILIGQQYMSVYLPLRPLADTAAQLAYHLLSKTPVPAELTKGETIDNGKAQVPLVKISSAPVYKDNIKSALVDNGFWSIKEICAGDYANACKGAGLQ